jgi:hypothetical protein
MVARSADNGSCKGVSRRFYTDIRGHKMAMPGEAGMGALTEDCSWRIVTGETGLAHTRTVNCQLESIIWLYLARC